MRQSAIEQSELGRQVTTVHTAGSLGMQLINQFEQAVSLSTVKCWSLPEAVCPEDQTPIANP